MPDWLPPEANAVADRWWASCEASFTWPETFVEAFSYGYIAGYQRRGRRRAPSDPEPPTMTTVIDEDETAVAAASEEAATEE